METIESTIREYQKANRNSSSSSNETGDAAKRRRGSAGIDSDVNDVFVESTVQSKKRVTKVRNDRKGAPDTASISTYKDRCMDLDLDGYDMETDNSNPKSKQKATGRILPQWSRPGSKGDCPIDNLFQEYTFKK